MEDVLSREELEAAYCWEAEDHVPRRPELTDFRRRLRYHQARWREANGHPIGSQPIVPREGKPSRPVGWRLPVDYARETGATFVTRHALEAAKARTSTVERHQSFDHQRLWADLLWSPTLAFNLFGDLAADLTLADRAVHAWWPDVPGTVVDVRFAHSPGRLDPAWLGNLVDFHAAFVLDLGDGTNGIVGVVTGYHDVNRRQPPKPSRLPRYREISERVGRLRPGMARGGQRDRADPPLARPPARAVDAPAPEPYVELGPARGRPPRRQHRLRGRVQPVPLAPPRSVDVRLRDDGGAPRGQRAPATHDQCPARAIPPRSHVDSTHCQRGLRGAPVTEGESRWES